MANRRIVTYCSHCEILPDLHSKAKVCGKVKQIISSTEFDDDYVLEGLLCGHWALTRKTVARQHAQLSLSYDKLLPFQKKFVNFAEKNACKVICRDEMGLGKTWQAGVLYDQNAELFTANYTKFCLIVCLPGSIYQWEEEMENFMAYNDPMSIKDLKLMPQIVVNSKQKISQKHLTIIIPWTQLGNEYIVKQILKKGIGSLIVDECHYYKDENSARTQNLIKLCKAAGVDAPKVFLSGTLIENRVMELFTAFNMMDPRRFSSRSALARMCSYDDRGKPLGIAPWWKQHFHDMTKHFVIGRTKAEVGIPLPYNSAGELAPEYHEDWLDPSEFTENREFADAYNVTLYELEELLSNPNPNAASIIGLMQQLRHHTGRMKILSAAVWIDNWMTFNPGEKLCVGVHHVAVREALVKLLKHHNPLSMSSEAPEEKDEIERAFKRGDSNLLICNILAAGTGRNFQFCRNAVILERQWNRSKEDQFAQRFHRIIKDSEGRIREHFTDEDMVHVYRLMAKNSFDEYFDELVDLKGMIVDSTEEGEEMPPVDVILKVARRVVANRLKWVGI